MQEESVTKPFLTRLEKLAVLKMLTVCQDHHIFWRYMLGMRIGQPRLPGHVVAVTAVMQPEQISFKVPNYFPLPAQKNPKK